MMVVMEMLFNYTTELRTFFEQNGDPSSHSDLIEKGRSKLFDFQYPIFDESYRKVFETHFIRKFYMRQIGFETFGLFKFQLESWLIINMPYFNKLMESELLKYDPLTNSKMNVSHLKKSDKTQSDFRSITDNRIVNGKTNMSGSNQSSQSRNESGTASEDNFDRQLESNTPDGRLNITANDGEGVIDYASNIKENNENNSRTSEVTGSETGNQTSELESTMNVTNNDTKNDNLVSTANDIEDYIQQRTGKIGVQSYAKLVMDYRKSLLRIENQIFDEMNQLFMLVY